MAGLHHGRVYTEIPVHGQSLKNLQGETTTEVILFIGMSRTVFRRENTDPIAIGVDR